MTLNSDDLSRILADAGRPGALDVALRESPTTRGRLTFAWDTTGDLIFDDSASYPVLMSILAHRGAYRWDRGFGTLLHKVTRERSTTGSQLTAYARDGGAAVEVDGLATNVSPRAERLASGRWRLRITWTAAGRARLQELSL